ncbi:Binder of sperm protein-like protein 1 [Camelus dromedarius]|uniref:Binder of sperm protein-like protein 1 n=1 Tax=Camelus dromedarius TaxID=9838 RepID=A0A5N4DSI2_CAMDR|nr:Binder of sperm protein-like protein 1 [Camelus dromedarius]
MKRIKDTGNIVLKKRRYQIERVLILIAFPFSIDFAKCVFPFWYRHLIYWECTDDGDAFGKTWCSLTQNYNKDKIWKYCD